MTGEELKTWRSIRRLTQAEAAAAIGCSERAIQQWESKRNKHTPKWVAMAVAAVAFDLPPYRPGE